MVMILNWYFDTLERNYMSILNVYNMKQMFL